MNTKIFLIIGLLFLSLQGIGQVNPTAAIKPANGENYILISRDTFGAARFIYDSVRFDISGDTLYFTDSVRVDLSSVVDTVLEIATKYDLTLLSSDNIYTSDGTLTGDRTVLTGNNDFIVSHSDGSSQFKMGFAGSTIGEPFVFETQANSNLFASNYYNLRSNIFLSDGATSTFRRAGILGNAVVQADNTGNNGQIAGTYGLAYHYGTANVDKLTGNLSIASHRGNGTTSNLVGQEITISNTGTGVVNIGKGIDISNTLTTGPINDLYGVYYNNTVTPTSLNFGLYINGETNNYISGKLGIGDETPSYPLDVLGDANVNGILRLSNLRAFESVGTRLDIGESFQNINFRPIGNLGVGTTSPTHKLHVLGDSYVTGAMFDSNNEAGEASQILSSTVTGTDWIDLPTSTNIYNTDGTLTANRTITSTGQSLEYSALDGNDINVSTFSDNGNTFAITDTGTGALSNLSQKPEYLKLTSAPMQLVNNDDYQLLWTDVETNSTTKNGGIGSFHYTNSEEPFLALISQSGSSFNSIRFGGGDSGGNAATVIDFYTASNNTTTTGTRRMRINASGNLGLGLVDPTDKLEVDGVVKINDFIKMVPTSTVPTSPASGWIYFDDGTNRTGAGPRYYNGSSWVDL